MSKKSKKKQDIKARRISPKLIVGLAVAFFVGVALFLRIVLPYDDIFTAYGVKFSGNDAYYYMRLVDNMVRNFPHLMAFDPYLIYPEGQGVIQYYLFARLLAGISWLVGLGNPSQHLVDAVCAYVPAILGALVVVPVYFIGRELGGRWCGLVCASLIAVLPGEFLGRSILGHADHHVAEVLFSATSVMFLAMAIREGKKAQIGLGDIMDRNAVKPIGYSLLAGLFLGVYGLTWQGGSPIVLVASLVFVAQIVLNHLRRRSVGYLCVVCLVFNLVAMAVFLPSVFGSDWLSFYAVSMAGALVVPLALGGLSWVLNRGKARLFLFPVVVSCLCVLATGVFYIANPPLFKSMIGLLTVFLPSAAKMTTIEMHPLLFPNGIFSLSVVWSNFGFAFFIALVSLAALVYLWVRHGDDAKCLAVVWAVVMLAMALGQRRFAYYLAANVALLSGWLVWQGMRWIVEAVPRVKGKQAVASSGVNVGLAVVVVFLVVFLPIIPRAVDAGEARFVPSDAWCESLDWLRENSPQPFSESDAYFEFPEAMGKAKADYAVLSWWDYGYWITRIAHRVPNVNPGQEPSLQAEVGEFLVAPNEGAADGIIRNLGSRYVIVDLGMVTGKFWAVAQYAGKDYSEYFGIYYILDGNSVKPVQVYYPEYYRSMAVRLYAFDGKAVVPQDVAVMSYEGRLDSQGNGYNLITEVMVFGNYDAAQSYAKEGNRRIVSDNPFASPVPLEAMEHYELCYGSSQMASVGGNSRAVSQVKIFEYAG